MNRTNLFRFSTVAVLTLIALGASTLDKFPSSPTDETNEIHLVWPDYGPNPVIWPIQSNKVSSEKINFSTDAVSPGQQSKLLLSGNADMATIDISAIPTLVEKGVMDNYVILSGYYIERPHNGSSVGAIYVPKNSDIRKPEELEGKTVALGEPFSPSNLMFKAVMANRYNLTPDDYNVVKKPDNADILLEKGDVDAALVWSSFAVSEKWNENYRRVVDFGAEYADLYGATPSNAVIMAPKEKVERRPGDYRTAIKLLRQSYHWSENNREKVAAAFGKKNPEFDRESWLKLSNYNDYYHNLTSERIEANNQLWNVQRKYHDREEPAPDMERLLVNFSNY